MTKHSRILNLCPPFFKKTFFSSRSRAIERCCAEVAGELRRITESPASEENQIELVTQLYPQFSDYFEQMSQIDPRFAGYALKHYVASITTENTLICPYGIGITIVPN